jgi:aryl-alcohol dehydrogenase-like predicted oxidoreductase
MSGWQTALIANELGKYRHQLLSTQVEYSLLERGIEREVVPYSQTTGTGIIAWSPLGRGVLTGKYRFNTPPDSRGASPHFAAFIAPYLSERARTIVDALALAAQGLSTSPAEVALRWQLSKSFVSSSILGARTASQLRALLKIDQSPLPDALVDALDEVSQPALGYPEAGWNQS